MGQTSGDRSGVRVALPDGWIDLHPAEADAHVGGDVVQLATAARWGGRVVRPTLSVTVTPATAEPIASRVLADAQARVPGVRVLAIDPWKVPGLAATGRRLVFTHLVGDVTVTTLVWAVATTVGDVMVTARSEGTELHVHDRAFAQAVAGLRLPRAVSFGGATDSTELFGRALAPAWSPDDTGSRTTIMADPHARILLEASVGRTSLRFDATLARDFATVWATASPRAITTAKDRADGGRAGATSFRVPPTRLALTIAEWLGLGPAHTEMRPLTLPLSQVMSRLVDPREPAPDGMDTVTWAQPWFLWTLRSSATDSGLVIVDTGGTGQVAVMEGEDERATRFSPLSSYNVWLTLNWLVNESLVRR